MMPTVARRSAHLLYSIATLACGVMSVAPALSADILSDAELRPPFVDRADAGFIERQFDPSPTVDVHPNARIRSTLEPSTPEGSSILRIGRAQGRERVSDGLVDRPTPRPNSAGSLPGGDTEGGLVVVRQDVRDLIEQVARFYGFDTVLTRQVRGELTNQTLPSDFNAFLARLANDRNLVFYFRNRELNASTQEENVSRVIGLGPSDPRELRAAIESAGVDSDRFPLQFIEASNSVLVNGPPSFVALVEVIAQSLVRTDRRAPEVTVIRGNTIQRSAAGATPPPLPAEPAASAAPQTGQ